MASDYKTPGVYIEEIPKFPPSIAQVETAIPAFIGYTAKADRISPGDLINKPTRIGSLVEYELYFGGGPKPTVNSVSIDDDNNFIDVNLTNNYYMYDSLRMFYINGGGDCYIVSVGVYKNDGSVAENDFTGTDVGIHTLVKFDEPTMLLFPDAVSLATGGLYNLQQAALSQCNDLQDRFGVFDLKSGDPKGSEFRGRIGINFLKYGAAYTPWLKVSLPKNVGFGELDGKITRGGLVVAMESLTTDLDVAGLISELRQAVGDSQLVSANIATLAGTFPSLRSKFQSLADAYTGAPSIVNFQNVLEFLYDIARRVETWVGAGPGDVQNADLKSDFTAAIASGLKGVFEAVISYEKELDAKFEDPYTTVFDALPAIGWLATFGINTGTLPASTIVPAVVAPPNTNAERDVLRMNNVLDDLQKQFEALNKIMLSSYLGAARQLAKDLDDSLRLSFPVYKNILNGINQAMTLLPPSGAVAGVYARVDRNRGVWKAPANESLFGVVEPGVLFSRTELDLLNVDAVAGKSINAIRSFTGKGTLVFGARTLAGNDNEWRYVSVRRFFNMVEESTKKATEQFVFEPNDANTWIRVQAMIENFLTVLWRAGALQGAKPEHAFYVAVGLGKTMTALDILEGRMIVEIGMAAVRPAEFIILKFSHKMAES